MDIMIDGKVFTPEERRKSKFRLSPELEKEIETQKLIYEIYYDLIPLNWETDGNIITMLKTIRNEIKIGNIKSKYWNR